MARLNEELYGSRSAMRRNRLGAIVFGVIAVAAGLALVLRGDAGGWSAVGIGAACVPVVTLLPKALGRRTDR
ncbi:hypothetical protein [Streptomyces sp. NPDC056600]|uniref:hypothetical protein n=1 Tax=Streptomyces sp. NPDC056600 TaxID=3345874 RepID=UPI0036C23493